MRLKVLIVCALLLAGCGSKGDIQPAEGYLTEKPGLLPPDRTALRVAQQFAPAGVSNQVRLMLLHQALYRRNRAPSFKWELEPAGNTYIVNATLSALQRPDTVFQWKVDFRKPPHLVCEAANREAEQLGKLRIKLDETGIEDWLGPKLNSETPAPTP